MMPRVDCRGDKNTVSEIDLEEIPEGFRAFAAVLLKREDRWHKLTEMLGTLGPKVSGKDASKMAFLIRERAPRHPFIHDVTDGFLRNRYPTWYINAVNDTWRNAAYRASLQHLATPDSVALEVGTGTGLFSMMAIQAGFRHVYTFESKQHVAKIAQECIRRNGFEDRITVIDKKFEFDDKNRLEIPEKPDVLMHEMSGDNLIVKDLFDVIKIARNLGVAEDIPILPHKFAAHAQLSGDPELYAKTHIAEGTEGLDLTAINILGMSRTLLDRGVALQNTLSEPFVASSHDAAQSMELVGGSEVIDVTASDQGTAYGVVHWICQTFPGGSTYENTPGRWCNWQPHYWPFREPRAVKAGDKVAVEVTTFNGNIYFQDA